MRYLHQLPMYDACLNKSELMKTIIDCDLSTLFSDKDMTQKLSSVVTKIRKPRKVNVAGKNVIQIDRICTVEMKLSDLPKETITMYTFPLRSGIDSILNLPWLGKHNSHVDWRFCNLEFNRDGRRYILCLPSPLLTFESFLLTSLPTSRPLFISCSGTSTTS